MTDHTKGKRFLILEAAYQLFLECGYSQTKISSIAQRANIGKGTVYEYFDSKEAIFSALFESFADEYRKQYTELSQKCAGKSAMAKLKQFMEFDVNTSDFIGSQMKLPPSTFIELELFKAPGLMPMFQRFIHFKFQLVYDCIQEGIKTGEFASLDPVVATVSFLGAFAFYSGFRNKQIPDGMHELIQSSDWDLEQLTNFAFDGLLARTE